MNSPFPPRRYNNADGIRWALTRRYLYGILLLTGLGMLACTNKKSSDLKIDPSTGLQFKFFNQLGKQQPQTGDFVEINLNVYTDKDSLLYSSFHRKGSPDTASLVKLVMTHSFKGCLTQGIAMMGLGDSAQFRINADSLYLKTFHSTTLPAHIKPGSRVKCNVKLAKIETAKQAQEEIARKNHVHDLIMDQRKEEEQQAIATYIRNIHFTGPPASNGMYILKDIKGHGTPIQPKDSLEIEFSARLLDGLIVEHSNHGDKRNTYTMAYKTESQLPGFEAMLSRMTEGEKVTVLFPSSLCFGNQQQGPLIGPYTPLIFDIHVVKVKHCK